MTSILTVVVKDSDRTIRKKFLLYETYQATPDDLLVRKCIAETIEGFSGEPERVTVRISFDL